MQRRSLASEAHTDATEDEDERGAHRHRPGTWEPGILTFDHWSKAKWPLDLGRWSKLRSNTAIPEVDFNPRLGLLKLQRTLLVGLCIVNRRSFRARFEPPHRAALKGHIGKGSLGPLSRWRPKRLQSTRVSPSRRPDRCAPHHCGFSGLVMMAAAFY